MEQTKSQPPATRRTPIRHGDDNILYSQRLRGKKNVILSCLFDVPLRPLANCLLILLLHSVLPLTLPTRLTWTPSEIPESHSAGRSLYLEHTS